MPMATANDHTSHPSSTAHPTMLSHDNGTSLIARAEALNAFMKMQPAADQARNAAATGHGGASARATATAPSRTAASSQSVGCFCFGGGGSSAKLSSSSTAAPPKPRREYYPDNLSVQPKPHPWDARMEWLIVACMDFLEKYGLHERNLFAVSAVDDLVRAMSVPRGAPLPRGTDPHVAAGVIKAKIRHADEPLVAKSCLRDYIDAQAADSGDNGNSRDKSPTKENRSAPISSSPNSIAPSFRLSFLAKTIDSLSTIHGPKRAYILARFMRLLGRVSANIESSRMNAHCLAKCVAPSMLHWDPNSGFALLMLGKITAYVMTMIEEARVFDESLCQKIDLLKPQDGW